ncbi:uncharacterized protein SAPINGB_P003808 [Magnusiomyces paraingens]|uniref:Cytochrome c oxidase subunit 8, mitochondrial n=1 Tax=Magnusiomyces paraingens TaxID=2606893 RepID=A0A5E8BRB8_9ASCO|nr:uncharacterized protein SAPINGB_P003808 [Saprochaete ingens]VVT53903.1 unnamed protein product [Saprochaete ingens]
MLSRAAVRTTSLVSRRGFSSSAISKVEHHWPEGPYTNIPFKVHNRKIPYFFVHWTFFLVGLGSPFAICYYQLKKSS